MTTRIAASLAAGMLALGILVGAAGAIVGRDATTTDRLPDMAGMMSGSMMGAGGMSGMMSGSMMGAGGMAGMMSGSMMGPNAPMSPGDHGSHHVAPSPAGTR